MSNISPILLELRDFSISRDDRPLFSGLHLALREGEIVQLIGRNGAGKTSLLRVIAGISRDFEGEFLYKGEGIGVTGWEFACNILYLPHAPGIKKTMTARENLTWYQELASATGDIDGALAKVGLAGFEDVPTAQMSAGQLRRVALARLYLSNARIWILDEPFTAIDKAGVVELESLFLAHSQRGGAVLLTSHQDLHVAAMRSVDLSDFPATSSRSSWRDAVDQTYE